MNQLRFRRSSHFLRFDRALLVTRRALNSEFRTYWVNVDPGNFVVTVGTWHPHDVRMNGHFVAHATSSVSNSTDLWHDGHSRLPLELGSVTKVNAFPQ